MVVKLKPTLSARTHGFEHISNVTPSEIPDRREETRLDQIDCPRCLSPQQKQNPRKDRRLGLATGNEVRLGLDILRICADWQQKKQTTGTPCELIVLLELVECVNKPVPGLVPSSLSVWCLVWWSLLLHNYSRGASAAEGITMFWTCGQEARLYSPADRWSPHCPLASSTFETCLPMVFFLWFEFSVTRARQTPLVLNSYPLFF